jgi:hypothetical protein
VARDMVGNAISIAINALVWGGWTFSFARSGANNPAQAAWYIYGPLAVLLATTVAPTFALATGRGRHGSVSTWLRGFLILALIGFLPYACMSGGGD